MYFQNNASGSLSDHCASPFGQFLNDLLSENAANHIIFQAT